MAFSIFSFFRLQKKYLSVLALSSPIISFLYVTPATAQVNVNHSALDNLGPIVKVSKYKPSHIQHKTEHPVKQSTHHSVATLPKQQQNKSTQSAPLPTIPSAPPPIPVIKDPELNIPLHPPAPPPMPKINPAIHGNVVITNRRTFIIFPADNSELNETMMQTVMNFANVLKQYPNTQVYLNAYSHGTPDDISTPRRNALNRGLTIRAVLINQGIPATRIYLVTKGIPEKIYKSIGSDYVEMIRSDLIDKK